MQKFYTVLFWWMVATLQGQAQSKTAFGFLVKAGNFALPSSNEKPSWGHNIDGGIIDFHQKPGEIYAWGLWCAQPLSKSLSILGELSFQHSIDRMESSQRSHPPFGSTLIPYVYTLNQTTTENSFSLPLKLQFTPQKRPKLSFAVGASINHLINARFFRTAREQFETFPLHKDSFLKQYLQWTDFKVHFNLLADVHFKLDAKTSLGIDYQYRRSSENYKGGLINFSGFGCDCDCGCDGYNTRIRPSMHSFSVSLRHNILN